MRSNILKLIQGYPSVSFDICQCSHILRAWTLAIIEIVNLAMDLCQEMLLSSLYLVQMHKQLLLAGHTSWIKLFQPVRILSQKMVSFLLAVELSASPILVSTRILSITVCQFYRFPREVGSKTESSQDGFNWILLLLMSEALSLMFPSLPW